MSSNELLQLKQDVAALNAALDRLLANAGVQQQSHTPAPAETGPRMEDIHPKMTDSDKKRVAGAIVRALREAQQ